MVRSVVVSGSLTHFATGTEVVAVLSLMLLLKSNHRLLFRVSRIVIILRIPTQIVIIIVADINDARPS